MEDNKLPPEALVALIMEGGKTVRWLIGGIVTVGTGLVTGYVPVSVENPVFVGVSLGLVIATLGVIVGGLGFLYGKSQLRFRQDKTAQLCSRITALEEMIDRSRTSSGLLIDGSTNPRDE